MYSPPPHSEQLIVSFPDEHVMLLTLNRPKSRNAMTPQMQRDLETVLDWFSEESGLWVAIVTGAGKLFCAGADLVEWNKDQQSGKIEEQERLTANRNGFGSISRRQLIKPLIAAVNGGAHGGGTEIVLNCDLVVAGEDAKFALPEVKRGVVAGAGGIPRLFQIAGHHIAAEMLLTGKTVSASEAHKRFGFVNKVVPSSEVVLEAIRVAQSIVANSPDAVQCTKHALLLSQKYNPEEAFLKSTFSAESNRVYKGGNIKEGLKAFIEKRSPAWKNPSKL
ncbi:ClpP/crotonase-like domain-containing protein [Lentinula edodes]|uniref:ClpP/crotonase-like domain-containing protein n=1 Tax=Lentinula lateritia TaxID=40482 RepID=A0A9W8ZYV6_9AGAR|nr:ClpP/crotonase-like domain-containing protein [Lentinula edodes]KAH7868732.1 ClpP/crotonase-like domain-containing protein [Lentinula edodes]KAJ3885844.1 enoyl-CoA hydratase [Lentinula edodes]KAJ4470413.1 ClpP/crotonase-like domain-containing protein [Lentinula edodes]